MDLILFPLCPRKHRRIDRIHVPIILVMIPSIRLINHSRNKSVRFVLRIILMIIKIIHGIQSRKFMQPVFIKKHHKQRIPLENSVVKRFVHII